MVERLEWRTASSRFQHGEDAWSGMFRARPRWTVSASGLAVPDRAGPARPPDPKFLLARPGQPNPSLLSTGPGPAWPPNPSLLSTGPGPARPPNPSLLSTALGPPGPPKSLTFIDGAGPAQPLTSIGQTPHFYQPVLAVSWLQTQMFPWTAAPRWIPK